MHTGSLMDAKFKAKMIVRQVKQLFQKLKADGDLKKQSAARCVIDQEIPKFDESELLSMAAQSYSLNDYLELNCMI